MKMKRINILVAVAVMLVLAVTGCMMSPQYARRDSSVSSQPAVVVGQVPVVFINSSGLTRHIRLFDGNESVSIVPDPRTGNWVLSRPSFLEFEIKPALSDDWAKEVKISLPRNFSFVVYDQPERFWGKPVGQPNVIYQRTGATPISCTYYRRTPSGGQGLAGAVVWLPWVDADGPDGLYIKIEISPRDIVRDWLEFFEKK